MTQGEQLLINPCGVASPPRYHLAPRASIPPGATLGILNNGKTNVSLILEQIEAGLGQSFHFADIVHIHKPAAALPCPEDALQTLQERCTIVVNGVGD